MTAPAHTEPRHQPSAKSRSLADVAYARLHDEILGCQLAPGERLTESALAERLSVGRMPVREALKRLLNEGLVRELPSRGQIVAPITLADVDEIFSLRAINESAAAGAAAGRLDAAALQRLHELAAIGYVASDPASFNAFSRANADFHAIVANAAGSRRLAALLGQLFKESQRLINYGMKLIPSSHETVEEHQALLEALERGDATDAARIARQHVESTRRMIIEGLLADSHVRGLPL